jgi:hypothetical protein
MVALADKTLGTTKRQVTRCRAALRHKHAAPDEHEAETPALPGKGTFLSGSQKQRILIQNQPK